MINIWPAKRIEDISEKVGMGPFGSSMLNVGVQFDPKKHRYALINIVKTILEASTLLAGALPNKVSSDITGNILTNTRKRLAELESCPHSIVLHVAVTESAASPIWGDVTSA